MSTNAEITPLHTEVRCFRLRRYYLYLGIVCVLLFAGMGVGSTVAALWNIDGSFPQPKLDALILGTFWSCVTLLAIWILAAYFRERLCLGQQMIVQQGVFRTRRLKLSEVMHLKWRTRPMGGSAVVRTHSEKVTIYLENFSRDERKAVIRFLRESLPEEIQENWSQFEEAYSSSPKPAFSRGGSITIAVLLLCFAGGFVYCWYVELGREYLVFGVVNAVAAVWFLWWNPVKKDANSAAPE